MSIPYEVRETYEALREIHGTIPAKRMAKERYIQDMMQRALQPNHDIVKINYILAILHAMTNDW